jgi:hypothetical protein
LNAKSTTTAMLCTAILAALVFPSVTAQDDGGQIVTSDLKLYMTNELAKQSGGPISACGTERVYNLTEPVDGSPGKAYINRAALEAGSVLGCVTDFEYNVTENLSFVGSAHVNFPLGCERVGLLQPDLGPIDIQVIVRHADGEEEEIENAIWEPSGLPVLGAICQTGFAVAVDIDVDNLDVGPDDALVLRLDIKAINTEKDLLTYFYIDTNPQNNASASFTTQDNDDEELPECSDTIDNDGDSKVDHPQDPGCSSATDDDETDSSPPPPPECSDGEDNDGDANVDHPADTGCTSPQDDDETDDTEPQGDAPSCARDDPAEAEITRAMDESFTLTAVCTDPDDDLDTGKWAVDDEAVSEEDLGDSPATVDEEFTFEAPGTHEITVTPTDEGGHDGEPATWIVHIVDNSGDGDAPTCARDEPPEFDISREADTAFTLSAVCEDADDDLDSGEWIVDDEPVAEDDLGDSPAAADEEFTFPQDECGTHHIHFVPSDEAGNVGAAATWRVTVTCDGDDDDDPDNTTTPTTPIPVFPSSLAFVLASVGALGGGFVILRRKT